MKKITLFAVALLAISFASCKKDYTCSCVTTSSSSSGTATSTSTTTIHATKSNAQKSCDAGTVAGSNSGQSFSTACAIK